MLNQIVDKREANSFQVGGDHYKTGYEHWDLVLACGMGYLEGQATKYLCRAGRKDGVPAVMDLKKALHYIVKLLENVQILAQFRRPNRAWVSEECCRFFEINQLNGSACSAIMGLGNWTTRADLEAAREAVLHLLDDQPVPLTEENHYAER